MNNLSAQKSELSNVNISEERVLITPEELKNKLPLSERARRFIQDSRETVANIIHKRDHRLLVVCGPCSIHDIDAARDYAKRLKVLAEQLSDELYLVMRVYFEKPRTTVGWKGLINDPHLDGSFDIEHGLHVQMVVSPFKSIGVDTPEDLANAESLMKEDSFYIANHGIKGYGLDE